MFVDTGELIQEMARGPINSRFEKVDGEMGDGTHVMREVEQRIESQIDALRAEMQRLAAEAEAKKKTPPLLEEVLGGYAAAPASHAEGVPLADFNDITREPQVLFPLVPQGLDIGKREQLVTALLKAFGANKSDDRDGLADNPTLKNHYSGVDRPTLLGRTQGGKRIEGIQTDVPGITFMYETKRPDQLALAMNIKTLKDMLDTPAVH